MTVAELTQILSAFADDNEVRVVRAGPAGDGLYVTNSRSEYVPVWPLTLD